MTESALWAAARSGNLDQRNRQRQGNDVMALHSFAPVSQLMVSGRLVYCRPAAKDWDVSPVFAASQRHGAAATRH